MDGMGMGIVGLGMALKPHAQALADLADRVQVRAAFSPSAQRRAQAREQYGLPPVARLEDVLEHPGVQSVLVLTPPWTHAELVASCLAAGKHVIVEKPLDVTAARGRALVEQARAAGRRLAVVFQHRFRPGPVALRALLAEGVLGPIVSASASVRWWRPAEYFAQPGRGMLARDGGGVLLTQAIHTLDLLLDLVGPARRVLALARTSPLRRIDTEDVAAAAVEYACGAIGAIDATTVAFPGYPERVEIAGTRGSARIEGERLVAHLHDGRTIEVGGSTAGGGGADPMAFSHEPHRRMLEAFLDAIEQGRDPPNSGASALAVLDLIDAMLASAREGAPVEVAGGRP